MSATFKGVALDVLRDRFSVRQTDAGEIVVPYLLADGSPYREKVFGADGRPSRWLGESKPQLPYGLDSLSLPGRTLFLTEGESDSWALRLAYPAAPVIGVPGASSWKPEWATFLRRFPAIYLSFDGDAAGVRLTDSVWPNLPWARRVRLPQGMDTRAVLQRYGSHVYRALLADADRGQALRAFFARIAKGARNDRAA